MNYKVKQLFREFLVIPKPKSSVSDGIKLKVKDNSVWHKKSLKNDKDYTGFMATDLIEKQTEYDLPDGLTKQGVEYIKILE